MKNIAKIYKIYEIYKINVDITTVGNKRMWSQRQINFNAGLS